MSIIRSRDATVLTMQQGIQARVQKLRSDASSSRQKAEEARASQQANTTQNKVLETLTRLQHAGRISGFHVSSLCLGYLRRL